MQGLTLILDRKSSRDGPAGAKIVKGRVTSVGVFDYPSAGRRDLRAPDQVFAPESLAWLKGAPVVRLHPPGDAVDPENSRELKIGHIGDTIETEPPKNGKQTGRGVLVDVYLTTKDAITDWETGGLAEASCGYDATLIEDAGEFEGAEYTHRQTKIMYNHVALGPVGWGRQGENVRLLDSKDPPMKIIIDSKEFETEEKAREYLQGKLGAAEAALTAEQAAHAKTKQLLTDAKDPKVLGAAVKSRASLVSVAKLALIDQAEEPKEGEEAPKPPTEEEIEDKDDAELKRAVITKAGLELPKDASADFIEGAYAIARKSIEAKAAEGGSDKGAEGGEATKTADSKDGGSGLVRPLFASEGDRRGRQSKIADGSEELEAAKTKANDHSKHTFAMSKS